MLYTSAKLQSNNKLHCYTVVGCCWVSLLSFELNHDSPLVVQHVVGAMTLLYTSLSTSWWWGKVPLGGSFSFWGHQHWWIINGEIHGHRHDRSHRWGGVCFFATQTPYLKLVVEYYLHCMHTSDAVGYAGFDVLAILANAELIAIEFSFSETDTSHVLNFILDFFFSVLIIKNK